MSSLCSQRDNWERLRVKFTGWANVESSSISFSQMRTAASWMIYVCFITTDVLESGQQ